MEAGARDLKGFGGDLSDQVEIDEAVVDRGNERVGARRKVAREDIVAPRRVGDEIVGALGQARDRGVEFVDGRALEHLEARHRQRDVAALRRAGAILQIAMEGALARVEVEPGDAPDLAGERHREMYRAGRFARAALFSAEEDVMRRGRSEE